MPRTKKAQEIERFSLEDVLSVKTLYEWSNKFVDMSLFACSYVIRPKKVHTADFQLERFIHDYWTYLS